MNKSVVTLIIVAVVAVGGVAVYKNKSAEPAMEHVQEQANIAAAAPLAQVLPNGPVKEFTMTSFFEMKDGKPAPQFSLKEIRVNKGDAVRLKITNTKGMHDFVIDEFSVRQDTPLNQEVVVEFTADKVGSFVYYCSKPNHRALGQWGTLVVEE